MPLLVVQLVFSSPGFMHPWVFGGLVGGGELLRLWAAGVIGRQSRTNDASVGVLATGGPYALVRNPLYIANTVQWVGLGAAGGVWWACAWLVMAVLLYSRVVPWEEKQLCAAWPVEFEQWASVVNAWRPSRPAGRAGNHGFSLRRALRSERSTLLVWAGITVLLAFH